MPDARAQGSATRVKSHEPVFDYDSYATILKRYVDDAGRVDYKELKANRKPLDAFVGSLGQLRKDFIPTHAAETRFTHLSKKKGAVLNYLKDHVSERDRRYLLSADYSVRYLDYDWTLNEQ